MRYILAATFFATFVLVTLYTVKETVGGSKAHIASSITHGVILPLGSRAPPPLNLDY